jgi:restriction system protein
MSGIKLDAFEYSDDVLHAYWTFLLEQKRKFDPWLESDDRVVVANALIVLTQRTISLLGKQLQSLEASFLERGGIREKMTQARVLARDGVAPECPECGKPMRKRKSQKGDFWGCSGYPDCRGSRNV